MSRARSGAGLLSSSLLTFGLCAAALLRAEPARAAAGEWQAGGRLGIAWLAGPRLGPEVEGDLRRGIGDSFDVDLQVLASIHPFQSRSKSTGSALTDSGTPWAIGIVPGVLYRWDVFRAVPYAGLGLGFFGWHGADPELGRTRLGVSGRVGLDYLLSRGVVLSVQASAQVVSADDTLRVPWVQLGLGAAHAWGW
ncbi:MAG TPA: hypothetical protein VG963_14755 [Polyangiaceae bacterium]|nr:hypothetical protein [Polyangiaceae bacterium]